MAPRYLDVQLLPGGDPGHVRAAVRVRRLWLPFFAAEMVSPWWAKPLVFALVAWHFWVLRRGR